MEYFIEKYAFGVCNAVGEYLKIPTSSIRLSFIYASFLTFGSPLILYLAIAFWMSFKKLYRRRENTLWYY
ncbi:MAG: PspC family transcriptional regulator [Flammeovirgaceae bacterium TMED32]|nr:MAG: PspC family transcriptional regulator [Flammeovirgaceae bacterium TMED32]|tara:strand:- start:1401 stop:1610 length:210 start_codon:yes stop_codon:yes gene_type:complete